jgi:hypothetical protein
MNVGMLWFDNDSNSDLTSKVARAASYYMGKYGDPPNICFIHPSMALNDVDNFPEEQKIKAGDVEVRLTKTVLPHHFWIGTQIQN